MSECVAYCDLPKDLDKRVKILIDDRNYMSWKFFDLDENREISSPILQEINPIEKKLFTGDLITYDGTIITSIVRKCPNLAGVLLLEKTYGRNETKKRLLYKCIPNDKRLPFFLIPYDMKLGFQKNIINKYITFRFDHWNDQHPRGTIHEMLGDVNSLEVYYEYQLYCRSLHDSIKEFTRQSRDLKNNTEFISKIMNNKKFIIEDRRDRYIFTIDPKTSTDLDDAFGIEPWLGGHVISIYISNVFFWMETFDLWASFSERVSTIYLPNYKRPLLPNILSNELCSLLENKERFAFVMDLFVDNNNIVAVEFKNAIIKVRKNYEYENPKMISKDPYYKDLLAITRVFDPSILDSHDLVTYWMIEFNKCCGKYMMGRRMGIFRSTFYLQKQNKNQKQSHNIISHIDISQDAKRVIHNWNHLSGQYVLFSEDTQNVLQHDLMQITGYIHITSPIRRLVDLLNQMIFIKETQMVDNMSQSACMFLDKWLHKLDYINTSMRSIRKIQTDCEILQRCHDDMELMKREHSGIVFDKIVKNDGFITYMVYLEDIKLLTRITTSVDVENYTVMKFRMYLFEHEYNIKRKIRLDPV